MSTVPVPRFPRKRHHFDYGFGLAGSQIPVLSGLGQDDELSQIRAERARVEAEIRRLKANPAAALAAAQAPAPAPPSPARRLAPLLLIGAVGVGAFFLLRRRR